MASADGTWERLFRQTLAAADSDGSIDWDISVGSTVVRVHQAGGRRRQGTPGPCQGGPDGPNGQPTAPIGRSNRTLRT
ncbi:hypothetical protein [Streptomyces sp. NPDC060035]|uniref:hypothetical protein n=1 Tax=Streptomyces sp. NPDC060035 TaxID=3347044 RepID=UPI0036B25F73